MNYDSFWDFGELKLTFQYDKTNNSRLNEGLVGRTKGMIANEFEFNTSRLQNYYFNGETIILLEYGISQNLTVGAGWSRQALNDPASSFQKDLIVLTSNGDRGKTSANTSSLYFKDNIEPIVGTNIIPGLRFDHHSQFGSNFSPSLNFSQQMGEYFQLKAGIARAFKAPNLYQSNNGYLLTTRGNGCPLTIQDGRCYLVGNDNLDPEVSINKEIGVEYQYQSWQASLIYFRNDYKNKIVAG